MSVVSAIIMLQIVHNVLFKELICLIAFVLRGFLIKDRLIVPNVCFNA